MTLLVGDLRTLPQPTQSPYLLSGGTGALGLYGPGASLSALEIGGTLVSNLPVSMSPRVIPGGQIYRSFFNDFYFRIHFTPPLSELGNILSVKEVPLRVWNSFFVAKSNTVASIPAETGVELVPPAGFTIPQDMQPLQEVEFTVRALLSGPPKILSDITFTIGGVEYRVPLTGKRVILFPFPPNWSSPFDETITYNSWVLDAEDGSEQTGSNWGNQPRRSFDYAIVVRQEQMQRLENLLFSWQHRLFGIPLWTDKAKLSSTVVSGAKLVPCVDTTLRAFEVGRIAVIYADEDNFEAFEIESITAGALNASSPLERGWPAGTYVYPVALGIANDSMSGGYQTDNTVVMPVGFDCEPTTSPVNSSIGPATPTYRGEELYLGKLNWKSPITFSYKADRRMVDFNTGTFVLFEGQGYNKPTRKHNWQIANRAAGPAVRQWIARREGVARPVYMPSGVSDFTLLTNVVSGAIQIDVADNGFVEHVGINPARRDIIILLRDGNYICRRINEAAIVSDGVARLTLDTTITQNITPAQVKRISYLGFYRLAANAVTLRWLNDQVATVEADLVIKPTP